MKRRRSLDGEVRWAQAVLSTSAGERRAVGEDRPVVGEPGWQAAWEALELPPAASAGPGFARRVALARAAERARGVAPLLDAGWMRVAAAAALVAGVALGSLLSWNTAANGANDANGANGAGDGGDARDGSEVSEVEGESWASTTLSEEYLSALQTPDLALTTNDSATPEAAP